MQLESFVPQELCECRKEAGNGCADIVTVYTPVDSLSSLFLPLALVVVVVDDDGDGQHGSLSLFPK